jgi:hypothetical protein
LAAITERGIPTFVHPRNYLNQTWQNRVLRVAVNLATVTRVGDVVIVADDDRFGSLYLPGRTVRPIVERDGKYYGPPRDDEEVISELRRMHDEGADFLAIGWPAFWWLKHYQGLGTYLEKHAVNVLRNEHVVAYRLQS